MHGKPRDRVDATGTGAAVRLTRRQRLVVAVALLTTTADGMDISIPGFVYPQLVREWGVSIGAITAVVTAGVVALAVGGAVAGPIADRYGRRPTTLVGVTVFGLCTAGLGLVGTIEAFATLRVLACLGLGATMPVVLAVVADAVPPARRAQIVALTFAGTALATIAGGSLAAVLIPTAGWPTLLLVCGGAPLLLLPAIAVLFTEPSPAARPGPDAPRGAVALVLSRPLLPTTLLVWLCFFIGIGVVFLIINYLPLIVERAGYSSAQAGVLVALYGWGALIGQVVVSWGLRRFDRFRVLALLWLAGAVGVSVTAALPRSFPALAAMIFLLGVVIPGASGVLQAIAALAYPPQARATGMGWTSAVGRLGSLASGVLGGVMIGAGWGLSAIFLTLGLPLLLGIGAALTLRDRTRRRGGFAEVDAGSAADAVPGPATNRTAS